MPFNIVIPAKAGIYLLKEKDGFRLKARCQHVVLDLPKSGMTGDY